MIAWVAARNGRRRTTAQTLVYRFPADTTIFGPAQIEARIDQDPVISAQISLWNQSGSKVIRGNLIVVPLDDALIYLQPVYLQSTGSAFPEFKRIVVASPRQVVWADTLGDALQLLLAAEAGASPGPTPDPSPGPSPGAVRDARTADPGRRAGSAGDADARGTAGLPTDVPGLIDYANTHFELAQTGAPRRRLRPLRRRDRAGPGRAPAAPGPRPGSRAAERGASAQPRAVSRGSGADRRAARRRSPTPATWPLALAAFLVRGGVVLVAVPIVVLPTPVGHRQRPGAKPHVRRVRVDLGRAHRRGRCDRCRASSAGSASAAGWPRFSRPRPPG